MAIKTEKTLLSELLAIAGPSGAEEKVQETVFSYLKHFAEEIKSDLHANLAASINKDAPYRVLLAAHCL